MQGGPGDRCSLTQEQCEAVLTCEDGSSAQWELTGCTCDACGVCDSDSSNDFVPPASAYVVTPSMSHVLLDSTIGEVGLNGEVWGWYNGTPSDASNGLSLFLHAVRDRALHRMKHDDLNPENLNQMNGSTTRDYNYNGILGYDYDTLGIGNHNSTKGVVLEYEVTQEQTLLISTSGTPNHPATYNDSIIIIFTPSHLSLCTSSGCGNGSID